MARTIRTRSAGSSGLVRTEHLVVEVRDEGPADGPVALLLHGWPDDATTWDAVVPRLHTAGFRTIAPMLRGSGQSRQRSRKAKRTGNPGILAIDAVELLDALEVEAFVVAGHDWGSGTAEAISLGWPKRVRRLAMLSSPPRLGGQSTPSFEQAARYWYQWLQATERGAEAIAADPVGFARTMWEMWSPPGWFEPATFDAVASSFTNRDWVATTLHYYRARWKEAKPDRRSARLERKVERSKKNPTPTLFIHGADDRVTPPALSEEIASKFSGGFERVVLPGVGHFPTREAPDLVAEHLVAHFV